MPGHVVDDLVGERVEEVELARGTASSGSRPGDFVQVRWFTGSQEPCESFTVTVAGSTEDGNRHAAVDLAERILLPSDLGDVAGDQRVEPTRGPSGSSTTPRSAASPTDGNGAAFSIPRRRGDVVRRLQPLLRPVHAAVATELGWATSPPPSSPAPRTPPPRPSQR